MKLFPCPQDNCFIPLRFIPQKPVGTPAVALSTFCDTPPSDRFKGLPLPAIGKDTCQPMKPQLCRGFLPSRLLRKTVMVSAAQAGSVSAAFFVCTVALVIRFRERSASPSTSLRSCLQAPVHPPATLFVLACWLIRLRAWRAVYYLLGIGARQALV